MASHTLNKWQPPADMNECWYWGPPQILDFKCSGQLQGGNPVGTESLAIQKKKKKNLEKNK